MKSSLSSILLFLLLLAALLSTVVAGDGDGEPIIVVVFLFVGLGVGILIMQILSWIGEPVPYTCVVFIVGVVFSVFNKSNADIFGESIGQWTGINGELLLFVFLPPLIFGEAMSLNWYHVQGGLLQSMILAGPGVLVGAALMGSLAKFMLPYDWNWNLAMEFGSILSATDPVAVVALLKSAGASPKLTILIVGESLLNDGTAMVLFAVFFNALNGTHYTAGSIILFFLEAAVGSVVFGMCIGLLTVRWLRSANRPLNHTDKTTQIAVTLASAYLTFFVAQYSLRISGVLACCGAGIMLAWLAPPIILDHEVMHNIWGMVEWVMNTFIFLLAGLIIGHRVIEEINALDWLLVFVLYVFLMIIRVVVIAMFYPIISRIGHKCTLNEAIFMAWAGLRGALGMALALIVSEDTPDDIDKETSRMFFYVGGIAALTLIINAPTARQLLVYLGLLGSDTAEKVVMMNHFKKQLKNRMEKVLEKMAAEFGFTPQDLDEVRASCSRLTEFSNMEAMYRESERLSMFLKEHPDRSSIMGGIGGVGGDAYRDARLAAEQETIRERSNEVNRTDSNASEPPFRDVVVNTDHPAGIMYGSFASNQDEIPAENKATAAGYDDNPVKKLLASNERPSAISISGGTGSSGGGGVQQMRVASKDDETRSQSIFTNTEDAPGAIPTLERKISITESLSRRFSRSQSISRQEDLQRKLTANRGQHPILTAELLSYVRGIFLEMVRVHYWHDIESGKLPRLSFSAQYLLYTVEVGLDQVDQADGATRDWNCVEKELLSTPFLLNLLYVLERYLPFGLSEFPSHYIGTYEATREKRAVYMLNSFIEAHVHAQGKIHEFIMAGDDHDTTLHGASPEEMKVIAESKQAVTAARELLAAMNPDTVAAIRSKQIAALVLAKEAEMVHSMVDEGLLSEHFAQELLDEISEDLMRIDKDRNLMYKKQGEMEGKRRQAQRKQERESGLGSGSGPGGNDRTSSLWKRGTSSSVDTSPMLSGAAGDEGGKSPLAERLITAEHASSSNA